MLLFPKKDLGWLIIINLPRRKRFTKIIIRNRKNVSPIIDFNFDDKNTELYLLSRFHTDAVIEQWVESFMGSLKFE